MAARMRAVARMLAVGQTPVGGRMPAVARTPVVAPMPAMPARRHPTRAWTGSQTDQRPTRAGYRTRRVRTWSDPMRRRDPCPQAAAAPPTKIALPQLRTAPTAFVARRHARGAAFSAIKPISEEPAPTWRWTKPRRRGARPARLRLSRPAGVRESATATGAARLGRKGRSAPRDRAIRSRTARRANRSATPAPA